MANIIRPLSTHNSSQAFTINRSLLSQFGISISRTLCVTTVAKAAIDRQSVINKPAAAKQGRKSLSSSQQIGASDCTSVETMEEHHGTEVSDNARKSMNSKNNDGLVDESELSSVPSDLSDDADNEKTSSRYFDLSAPTGLLATKLGKRQRFTVAEANLGETKEMIDRKRIRSDVNALHNMKELVSSVGKVGNDGDSPTRRKRSKGSKTTNSNSQLVRPATDPLSKPKRRVKGQPKAEEVEEEVKNFTIKGEQDNVISLELVEGNTTKPTSKARNKQTKSEKLIKPLPPPSNWEEMYDLVREMRKHTIAPVDTMGCERLAEPPGGEITPAISRFQTLVSLLLSSQTKDTITAAAIRKLQTALPGGLTIPSILSTTPAVLDSLITPVGFHNRKTQYLLQTAQVLKEKYNSDIPRSIEELCSLPGVGPKMAHLCMSAAWGDTQGIGVDVHVHRITNMWGWTGKKGTDTPEQTRVALESWLPRDRWREINYMLVGFGQTICLSRGPKCEECKLAERGLCRAARVPPLGERGTIKEEVKVKVEVVKEEEEEKGKRGTRSMKVENKKEITGISTRPRRRPQRRGIKSELEQENQKVRNDNDFNDDNVIGSSSLPKLKVEIKKEEEEATTTTSVPDIEDTLLSSSLPSTWSRRRRKI